MEFQERGLTDVWGEIRTEAGETRGEGRAPGTHLSQIVGAMRRARGLPQGIEGEQEGIRMQMGFLWEHALQLVANGATIEGAMDLAYKRWKVQSRGHVITQITGEKDGIHMTPDGLDCQDGVLDSYKFTFKSMRKAATKEEFEENFWPWLVAEKGYCLAWGVDTVRFFICWAGGDYSYKKGHGPQERVYDCVFTREELVENWAAVLKYKGWMEDPFKGMDKGE